MHDLKNQQNERMYDLESRSCTTVKKALEKSGWTLHAFDWFPIFSMCKRYDLYEENKSLWVDSYELYRPSRPDFIAKSPIQLTCLVEVKGKSKHDLIIDNHKYDSYIYWERFLMIPVFVVFYAESERDVGQTGLYLHKIQDSDIRIGEARYGGKGFINPEKAWSQSTILQIKNEKELGEKLIQLIKNWDNSNSSSRWTEREGSDLITDPDFRFSP